MTYHLTPRIPLAGIAQLAEIERRSRWSAARMLAHKQRKLGELLKSAWASSAFYRAHLGAHGVREGDLRELSLRDLPITSKCLLADHFDDVVTVPGLTRSVLEQWLEANTDPESVYDERLVIVRSSGSAGAPGIFVYDREAWDLVHRIASVRLPRLPDGRGARYAFYNLPDGRHVGITHARKVASTADHALFLSVLGPLDEAVSSLNDLQPDVLIGYANAVHLLAAEARSGRLRIRPSLVLTSAEPLTNDMERDLVDVWPAVVSRVYSCTESVFVAGQRAGEPWMTVLDDACCLEVVDDEGNEVAPGESGRALLTNLYNRAMPIVRYDLQDVVTRGDPALSAPFTCIAAIDGPDKTPLPVLCDDGSVDALRALLLGTVAPTGSKGVQFISERPGRVLVRYVGEPGLEEAILAEMRRFLTAKRALATTVRVRRVERLARSRLTGKTPFVVTDPRHLLDAGDDMAQ